MNQHTEIQHQTFDSNLQIFGQIPFKKSFSFICQFKTFNCVYLSHNCALWWACYSCGWIYLPKKSLDVIGFVGNQIQTQTLDALFFLKKKKKPFICL